MKHTVILIGYLMVLAAFMAGLFYSGGIGNLVSVEEPRPGSSPDHPPPISPVPAPTPADDSSAKAPKFDGPTPTPIPFTDCPFRWKCKANRYPDGSSTVSLWPDYGPHSPGGPIRFSDGVVMLPDDAYLADKDLMVNCWPGMDCGEPPIYKIKRGDSAIFVDWNRVSPPAYAEVNEGDQSVFDFLFDKE